MTTETDKKSKLPEPINYAKFFPDRLSYDVVMTRAEYTVVKDGKDSILPEKWELVAMYDYPNGKRLPLHLQYGVLPCYINKAWNSQLSGDFRKIYARVDPEREIFSFFASLEKVLKEKLVEAILTKDCSKVLDGWQAHVATGNVVKKVLYSDFISSKLAGRQRVGTGSITVEAAEEAFRTALSQGGGDDEEEHTEPVMRTSLITMPKAGSEYKPTKFIEVTGYPTKPKSDSEEDRARFEVAKVQGNKKIILWCHADARGRLINDGLLGDEAWVPFRNGLGHYTTDYHVMTHIKKGHTPWIALSATLSWRKSISKKGEYRIVLDEKVSQGVLIDIRKSEFTASSNNEEIYTQYASEFGRGTALHTDQSLLAAISQGTHDSEVVYAPEMDG
jgi:hypothetical protein